MDISAIRRRTQRGSTMLETSLVLLLFLAMMIGTFDFGQFLFIHQALVERARGAARWGAINGPTDTTSIQNMVMYNQAIAPANTGGYLGLDSSMVQVSTSDSGTDNYRLNVLITNYPYQVVSLYIAGTYTGPNILVSVPLGL